MLDRFDVDPNLGPDDVEGVVAPADLRDARAAVADVHVAEPVKEYILDIVAATRAHDAVEYGASPRASLAFLNAAKASAALDRRGYAIPADVKAFTNPILGHRLVLNAEAELGERSTGAVITKIVETVAAPSAQFVAPPG